MGVKKTSTPIDVQVPEHGVFVVESHHGDDFRMEWTLHPFHKLIQPINGEGILHLKQSSSFRIDPSQTVFIPQNTPHKIEDSMGEAMSLWILCILPEVTRSLLEDDLWKKPFSFQGDTTSTIIQSNYRRILLEQTLNNPGSSLKIHSDTFSILLYLLRNYERSQTSNTTTSETRIYNYIQEMPYRIHELLTLDEVAGSLYVSTKTFSSKFRKQTGHSWLQYQTNLRIQHACKLLKETNHSILSICHECGFEDLSHFHRVFKKKTRMTPMSFRKNNF